MASACGSITKVCCILSVLISGCSIAPSYPTSYRNKALYPEPENQPLKAVRVQDVPRARLIWQGRRNGAFPDYFVGVGVSGGGSRAASFGASSLEKLDQLGFLNYVTAISSVSGGSLPSAYFALNGDDIPVGDWSAVKDLMKVDFFHKWLWKAFNPFGLTESSLSDRDRSDQMAEVFDEVLFHGKQFKDLGTPGRRRPILLVNATNITSGGTRFTFTEPYFDDINSELSSYPIAWAVMASGAFPGVFNSVTLKQHWRNVTDYRGSPVELFSHLMDGGPSDNLGLDALAEVAQNIAIETVKAAKPFRGCFFFLIDSHVSTLDKKGTFDSDLRKGVIEHIVDFNFFDAIDTLLTERRRNQLAGMGMNVTRHQWIEGWKRQRIGLYKLFEQEGFNSRNSAAFVITEDPTNLNKIPWNITERLTSPGTRQYYVSPSQADTLKKIDCVTWHIALDDFNSIPPVRGPDMVEFRNAPIDSAPIVNYRNQLQWHTSKIKTHYYLTGILGADQNQSQELLDLASRIAIFDDEESRRCTCSLFLEMFNDSLFSANCSKPMEPVHATYLNIKYRKDARYPGMTPIRTRPRPPFCPEKANLELSGSMANH